MTIDNDEVRELFEINENGNGAGGDDQTPDIFSEKASEVGDILSKVETGSSKDISEITQDMVKDDVPEGILDANEKEVLDNHPQQTYEKDNSSLLPKSEIGHWIVENANPKFEKFYKEKIDLVNKILVDGPVPFDQYRKELKGSSVDISAITFDPGEIHKQMRQVQGCKERVKQIQIHCNSQVFLWERGLQMMHGVLSRIEFDKPLVKYDGIIYEHMRDMELYFAKLRGLISSAEGVMKTLEGAHQCLSRQVTIAMPLKSIERYQSKSFEAGQVVKTALTSEEFSGFDTIDAQDKDAMPQLEEKITKSPKGVSSVEWGDIE